MARRRRRTDRVSGTALTDLLRGDQIQAESRPAEVCRAISLGREWVVELADPAAGLHGDGAAGELARDIVESMRAKAPVQVPVHVDPRGTAPGRLRLPGRIDRHATRGHARHGT